MTERINEYLDINRIILIQKKDQSNPVADNFFTISQLDEMMSDLLATINLPLVTVPEDNVKLVSASIETYIDRYAREPKLAKLDLKSVLQRNAQDSIVQSVLNSIELLVSRLTSYNTIHDSELRLSSFIDNFLVALFLDETNCSNKVITERKTDETDLLDTKKPDYKENVMKANSTTVDYTNLIGEIKLIEQIREREPLALDMYRLCLFSKDAIKRYNLKYVLCFQTVGTYLTFYLMVSIYDVLYPLLELDKIYIPTTVNDLCFIVFCLPQLTNIVNVYQNLCFKSAMAPSIIPLHTDSLEYDTVLSSLISSKNKSKERNCIIDYDNYTSINTIITESIR